METNFKNFTNENSYFGYKLSIRITQENRDELKTYYNKFQDDNKGFSWGYYMVYDQYDDRFHFTKNKTKLNVVGSIEEFIDTHNDIKDEEPTQETGTLDYWERQAEVRKQSAMDNKPWSDVNPSY